MTKDKINMREWSERLEAGEHDDDLLALAARLEKTRGDAPAASVEFRRQLRRDLLNQYETTADRPANRLWRFAGSVTAIGVLAVIVIATWLSMSSAGRGAFGDAPNIGPAATALPPDGSRYTFLDHSIHGGIITETMQADGGEEQTQSLLVPGMDIEVITHWSVPLDAGEATAFVHLVQGDDTIIAQSNAPIQTAEALDGQRAKASLTLSVPADLAPGAYRVVSGLYDPTTDEQLPFSTPEGEVTSVSLGEYEVSAESVASTDQSNEAVIELPGGHEIPIQFDSLVVREVTPESGTLLTGDDSLDFVITLDYTLSTLPEAVVDAKVATNDGIFGGRGVGHTTAIITRGRSTIELKISVNRDEFLKPTDLGLWLQLKPDDDPNSAPILVAEMPSDKWHWRYEP